LIASSTEGFHLLKNLQSLSGVRMNTKNSLRLVVVLAILVVLLAACSADLKKQIVGQWEMTGQNTDTVMTFSFKEDGSLTIWVGDVPLNGTYEWLDEDTIQMTLNRGDTDQEIVGNIQIEGDRLSISNENGEVDLLTRVK
jgi:uncharacterized protein (TIGR03066 family)